MPQAAFNARWIESIKPDPARQIEYYDSHTPGLGLRLSPRGTRAFFYWYRVHGRLRKVTLGKYDAVHFPLVKARRELDKLRGRVANHEDPAEERAVRRKAETIAELSTLYIERHAKVKKKSWAEDERILNKDILPKWKHRKIHDIRRKDVIALIDEVAERGPVMAANTLALVRKVFNFAIERDLLQSSPCVKIPRPCKYVERERVLPDSELRVFLTKLASADMSAKTRLALELVLRTALRPGEVAQARWDEIEGEWWTIPAERSKNGLAHRVPITGKVCDLLNDAYRLADDSDFLFPVPKRFPHPHGPLHPEGMAHAMARNREHFGIGHFVPHDLRRTAATALSSLGVRDDVIDAVLNHRKRGVLRVYNRYSYDAEKRQALELWQSKLDSLIKAKPDEQN